MVVSGIPSWVWAAEPGSGSGGEPGSGLRGGLGSPWLFAVAAVVSLVVLGALWGRDVIRPGSFRGARARRVGEAPWFVWLAAGVVVFMAWQVGGGLALQVLGGPPAAGGTLELRKTAIVSVSSYVAAGIIGVLMVRALRGTGEGLEFRARGVRTGLGAFLMAYPVLYTVTGIAVLVATLVRGAPLEPVAHESLRQIIDQRESVWAWVLAGGAVVGAPVVEELIYRVFLQSALLRLTGRTWVALLAASAIFAAVHIGVAETHALPVLLVLGLSMGIAYERTRNPVVPIVMHAAFNLLNVVLALGLR